MNLCIRYFPTDENNWYDWEKLKSDSFKIKSVIITGFINRYYKPMFEVVLKVDSGKVYKHFISCFDQLVIEESINTYKLKKFLTNKDILKLIKYLVRYDSFIAEKYYYKKRNYIRETIIYSREVKV